MGKKDRELGKDKKETPKEGRRKNNTSKVGFNVGLYMSPFHFNVFFFSINPLLRIRYLLFFFFFGTCQQTKWLSYC